MKRKKKKGQKPAEKGLKPTIVFPKALRIEFDVSKGKGLKTLQETMEEWGWAW